ncbi:hypothetical protein ND450_14925 [Lentzea sp. HUAS12]|nr:hypothetical protein [Lentzea sp. HUAS12]USX55342.1 hypothetical protein ND450_14925 [Lentzea sp. HUAS12]
MARKAAITCTAAVNSGSPPRATSAGAGSRAAQTRPALGVRRRRRTSVQARAATCESREGGADPADLAPRPAAPSRADLTRPRARARRSARIAPSSARSNQLTDTFAAPASAPPAARSDRRSFGSDTPAATARPIATTQAATSSVPAAPGSTLSSSGTSSATTASPTTPLSHPCSRHRPRCTTTANATTATPTAAPIPTASSAGTTAPTSPNTAAVQATPSPAPTTSSPENRGHSNAPRRAGELSTQNIRSAPANTGPNASAAFISTAAPSTDSQSALHALPAAGALVSPAYAHPFATSATIPKTTSRECSRATSDRHGTGVRNRRRTAHAVTA